MFGLLSFCRLEGLPPFVGRPEVNWRRPLSPSHGEAFVPPYFMPPSARRIQCINPSTLIPFPPQRKGNFAFSMSMAIYSSFPRGCELPSIYVLSLPSSGNLVAAIGPFSISGRLFSLKPRERLISTSWIRKPSQQSVILRPRKSFPVPHSSTQGVVSRVVSFPSYSLISAVRIKQLSIPPSCIS